ncbi:MAG: DUF58 domain-containing protein [Firmicutes bacterium]|nr:DUF58 domain-containing protein [Bacillota bacterium]
MLWDYEFLKVLERLELVTRHKINTHYVGKKVNRKIGAGLEFAEHRPYYLGDDFRHLDWNVYSRLGQLVLKQFVEEQNSMLMLLIDKSTSMGFGELSKLEFACKLAGSLGFIALNNLDRVGVCSFANSVNSEIMVYQGKKHFPKLFESLTGIATGGITNFNQAMFDFCKLSKSRGLAIVFSDFFDPKGYQDGIRTLVASGWEVWAFQILEPTEIDVTVGSDFLLIDSETGESKEVYVDKQVAEHYQQALYEFTEEMRRFCLGLGAYYLRVVSTDPIENVIFSTLRSERRVR